VIERLRQKLRALPVATRVMDSTGMRGDDATPFAGDGPAEGATVLAPPRGPGELGWLGGYRVLRLLGAGGMGVVYEAEDARLRRRVAIKLLPPEFSRDRAAKNRFLREARAASALDDPRICTVHDIGEHDGRLYIVMALYEGETLKERLARGPLPVDEARQIAIQVARA